MCILREDNLEKKGQCTVYNIAQWLLYTLQFWGRLILEQMVTVPLFLAYIVIMLDLKLKLRNRLQSKISNHILELHSVLSNKKNLFNNQ